MEAVCVITNGSIDGYIEFKKSKNNKTLINICFEAVPTPAVRQRRSVSPATPWHPKFEEFEDKVDSTVHCTRIAVERSPRTRTNRPEPKSNLNRRATQARTQDTNGNAGNDSGKARTERTGRNPDEQERTSRHKSPKPEQPLLTHQQSIKPKPDSLHPN